MDEDVAEGKDPVGGVVIGVSSLTESLAFWKDLLGMKVNRTVTRFHFKTLKVSFLN